ncbi:hypothetical protein EI94DRAFT_1831346 [Lactarius quietus]|nr:hypothetical protein EI94DRAFT_1831346 [Lactarius quietus]
MQSSQSNFKFGSNLDGDSHLSLSPTAFQPRQVNPEDNHFGDFTANLPGPRFPQLRSRPPMDFPLQQSSYPSSHISGSTLHTNSNQALFARKSTSLGFSSGLSVEAIASLTVNELHYNPHYHELRKDHDYISQVLASYMQREMEESRTDTSAPLITDVRQVTALRGENSQGSSLGPSDLASQQSKFDSSFQQAIINLLNGMEVPSIRPEYLPISVLL